MATGKKTNEELKASKLFDVSGFTAVVTGGGTGIGLSNGLLLLTSSLVTTNTRRHSTLQNKTCNCTSYDHPYNHC